MTTYQIRATYVDREPGHGITWQQDWALTGTDKDGRWLITAVEEIPYSPAQAYHRRHDFMHLAANHPTAGDVLPYRPVAYWLEQHGIHTHCQDCEVPLNETDRGCNRCGPCNAEWLDVQEYLDYAEGDA